MTLARRPALLLCILAACLPGWHMVGVDAQQGQGEIEITLAGITEEPLAPLPKDDSPAEAEGAEPEDSPPDAGGAEPEDSPPDAGDCREVQYPCTRMYSVHRPVKQCISQVCVSSIKRVYMVNNEICSRMVCKDDETMEEERCRQKMGLPPRRSARSNYPCKQVHYGIREHGVL